ncbi:MAG TPA: hypothetical protein PKD99_10815 [Sphingopyxis sp.]|nr:hypothetical protein [Sphingopyxis sp.]HMP45587.1 hypothetical protein [Sphingopyxis sp.]HMQ17705.1 hypothetical protein [Sphingopyxis sp.]
MTVPLVTIATVAQCPHAIPGTLISSASKVLVMGAPPLVLGDKGSVAGCPFQLPGPTPSPCVTLLLTGASAKVMVEGKPALKMNPSDMGQAATQAPQGPVIWASVQTKVLAT